jgi:hypothetical protein
MWQLLWVAISSLFKGIVIGMVMLTVLWVLISFLIDFFWGHL